MDELKSQEKPNQLCLPSAWTSPSWIFYDDLARKTNRSRNELIGLALEYAKDKIKVES